MARKEKTAAAAREAKRRLVDNPLTGAENREKELVEVERHGKIQRTAGKNSERARVEAERRSAARVGGLKAEAAR
jgi:hypothetical protein